MNCQKVTFTKKEALESLKHIKNGKQYRKETRTYYCSECNAWHLTSHDKTPKEKTVHLTKVKQWKKLLKPL